MWRVVEATSGTACPPPVHPLTPNDSCFSHVKTLEPPPHRGSWLMMCNKARGKLSAPKTQHSKGKHRISEQTPGSKRKRGRAPCSRGRTAVLKSSRQLSQCSFKGLSAPGKWFPHPPPLFYGSRRLLSLPLGPACSLILPLPWEMGPVCC